MSWMKRQFTATCYIRDQEKFLLILHPKFKKWLPPGGHLEPNETPPEGAKREVLEETGLEVTFYSQENLWVDEPNAKSIERPFFCFLENVPSHGEEPPHQHIDFIYVGYPTGGELKEGRWFTYEEVMALSPEEVFRDTQKVIQKICETKLLFETLFQKA